MNYSATKLPEHLNFGWIPPFFRVPLLESNFLNQKQYSLLNQIIQSAIINLSFELHCFILKLNFLVCKEIFK